MVAKGNETDYITFNSRDANKRWKGLNFQKAISSTFPVALPHPGNIWYNPIIACVHQNKQTHLRNWILEGGKFCTTEFGKLF